MHSAIALQSGQRQRMLLVKVREVRLNARMPDRLIMAVMVASQARALLAPLEKRGVGRPLAVTNTRSIFAVFQQIDFGSEEFGRSDVAKHLLQRVESGKKRLRLVSHELERFRIIFGELDLAKLVVPVAQHHVQAVVAVVEPHLMSDAAQQVAGVVHAEILKRVVETIRRDRDEVDLEHVAVYNSTNLAKGAATNLWAPVRLEAKPTIWWPGELANL